MKKIIFVSFFAAIISSCANFEEPEFISTEGIKMGKIEARNISVTANIKVSNQNWFAIKIKPCNLDAYIENQYMGKIFLEKKVKMKPKSETILSLPLRAELADGAMITVLKYATKDKVDLHIKGKVKAGVWLISKKIDVDEIKSISGKNLLFGSQD